MRKRRRFFVCMFLMCRRSKGRTALPGDAVGCCVAGDEAEQAAGERGNDVGTCREVVAGAEEHGVFKGKGGQGGVAAAEPGGEGEPQVG